MLLGGFRLLWHSDYAGGCAALIWSDWKLRLSWSSALVSTWPPRFRQHAGGFMLCCWIVEAMARQCSGTVSYGCLTSDEISLFILADFAADVRMLWLIVMVNRTMTYLCLFFFFLSLHEQKQGPVKCCNIGNDISMQRWFHSACTKFTGTLKSSEAWKS